MPTYNDQLEQYVRQVYAVEDEALRRIREETPRRGLPSISVKPEEGRNLQFLAHVSGARRALEIGTLGGYSGTWIARGLASDGRLITLERDPRHAQVAKEHFQIAGVADRVEVRVGDAHELLHDLGAEGPFDFVFIDAEKEGYLRYLEWCLLNVQPGGVIAAHNTLSHGAVIDPHDRSARAETLRAFNERMANEPRLLATLLPAGDGTSVAVVRS